jgi:predicted dehydrogenase
MGRAFASALARWHELAEPAAAAELTAVSSRTAASTAWFGQSFPNLELATTDYRELLASDAVDAVYVAVPNHLHEQIYCDVLRSGKHLFGEKPFGIDQEANSVISTCIQEHPELLVRCSSEFPFAPAVQMIGDLIESGEIGRVIEVNAAFRHSSDLNPEKPLNWKRQIEVNGAYGVMGDLGMHVCHVPFRAGWRPGNVRAILSNIVTTRPDGTGARVACDTWDNATLLCETNDPSSGTTFPMTLRTQRISPGETNTWELEILGTRTSMRFSTKNINVLHLLRYDGSGQEWRDLDIGHKTRFPTITGGIFEVGFGDLMLQMVAAFVAELATEGPAPRFATCVTPDEVAWSHRLFTAALRSQSGGTTEAV